jgi:surfeit locus 1 family protein
MTRSLTVFNYTFTSSWRMFFITCISMALFISLGIWQVKRGCEKKLIIQGYFHELNKKPKPWSYKNILPKQYQKIKVSGRFLPQMLLLDNQHRNHKFGYNVLLILKTKNNKVILIDKGWTQALNRDYTKINQRISTQKQTIIGSVYYPSSKQILLGEPI